MRYSQGIAVCATGLDHKSTKPVADDFRAADQALTLTSSCSLMSSKDNAAMNQLLSLLEARYAMRVLWALRDGHAQTFRLLQDSVGGITPNTLNTRIKGLRDAGLLEHGNDGYRLTTSGNNLVKRLGDLPSFASKWTAGQDHPTA